MSLTLSMDFQFTTSIEKLWSAITDSGKLAKWIADNDFKPVVGHRFQFRHQPNEYWDGIVNGEVLIVDEQDLGDGKVNLHLEQTGFSNVHGLEGAKYGWGEWVVELEKVLAQ